MRLVNTRPRVELVEQRGRGARAPSAFVGAGVRLRRCRRPANRSRDLADARGPATPASLQLVEVGRAPAARARSRAGPCVRANAPGLAVERPGDDAADGVLARITPRTRAHDRVQLVARAARRRARRSAGPSPATCRGSARRCAGARSPKSLDRRDAVVRAVAAGSRGPLASLERARRPRAGSRRGRSAAALGDHDAHELPVAGRRVLARARAGAGGRGATGRRRPAGRPRSGRIEPSPRRSSAGRSSPPTRLGEVAERVRRPRRRSRRRRAARRRRRRRGRRRTRGGSRRASRRRDLAASAASGPNTCAVDAREVARAARRRRRRPRRRGRRRAVERTAARAARRSCSVPTSSTAAVRRRPARAARR